MALVGALKYILVLNELRRRIESGTYRPGAALPSENRIAAEFGAARATVGSDATSTAPTRGSLLQHLANRRSRRRRAPGSKGLMARKIDSNGTN